MSEMEALEAEAEISDPERAAVMVMLLEDEQAARLLAQLDPDVLNARPSMSLAPGEAPTGETAFADLVLHHEQPGRLLTYFSDHKDDYRRLTALHPMLAMRELGRLEARLDAASSGSVSTPSTLSQAKPPIQPVGRGASVPIGARDPNGIRPLILGELNGAYILCSETCALDIIGAKYIREIENGEVVVISDEGIESLRPFTSVRCHQHRSERRAYACGQTVLLQLGDLRASDHLHWHACKLKHARRHRILQQAGQGILACRTHHDLRDLEFLRHAVDGLGTIPQLDVRGMRNTVLFKQFGFFWIDVGKNRIFAPTSGGKAFGHVRQGHVHLQ